MIKNIKIILALILLSGSVNISLAADVSTRSLGGRSVLPDTGQTVCSNNAGGVIVCPVPGDVLAQDGSYNKPAAAPSYTDNGNNTITDKRTGLMWVKDPLTATGIGGTYDWMTALGACENGIGTAGNYAGYSDWRLPNIRELNSLVAYQNTSPNPTIDLAFFPNTFLAYYWSSTSDAAGYTAAWVVTFFTGFTNVTGKAGLYYVRCVRGGF